MNNKEFKELKKIEEIKHSFWERVLEVSPSDIKSETILVVSDADVDWLVEKIFSLTQRPKNYKEAIDEKFNNPMSQLDNIIDETFKQKENNE